MVIHDLPAAPSPLDNLATDFVYLRFHGPGGDYRGSFTNDFLSEYAEYIKNWHEEGKDIYLYLNNTMGDAVKNLITLNNYLKPML